jgi:hypothetical protein
MDGQVKMDKKYQIARGKRIRRYGITVAEYDRLFADQNGVCAICGNTNDDIALCIDHDHKTNEVRGLLCNLCNRAIGLMKDDYKLLIKAAVYVRKGVPWYLKGKIVSKYRYGVNDKTRVWNGITINWAPDQSVDMSIEIANAIKMWEEENAQNG